MKYDKSFWNKFKNNNWWLFLLAVNNLNIIHQNNSHSNAKVEIKKAYYKILELVYASKSPAKEYCCKVLRVNEI